MYYTITLVRFLFKELRMYRSYLLIMFILFAQVINSMELINTLRDTDPRKERLTNFHKESMEQIKKIKTETTHSQCENCLNEAIGKVIDPTNTIEMDTILNRYKSVAELLLKPESFMKKFNDDHKTQIKPLEDELKQRYIDKFRSEYEDSMTTEYFNKTINAAKGALTPDDAKKILDEVAAKVDAKLEVLKNKQTKLDNNIKKTLNQDKQEKLESRNQSLSALLILAVMAYGIYKLYGMLMGYFAN